MRLTWDELFLHIAHTVSLRSTCPRLHVGAVLSTSDNRILSIGYNGAPKGLPHCVDVGCHIVGNHCVRTVHAEMNAIGSAAFLGIPIRGATLYVTDCSCIRCANVQINVGIRRVVLGGNSYDSDGLRSGVLEMYDKAGIEVVNER